MGWVGSLAWLQQRNMLYGTELAEKEDKRAWEGHRAQAPLDREVDPWGFERLQLHLHKMWWGRDPEEMEQNHHLDEEAFLGYNRRQQEEAILYEAPATARQTAPAVKARFLAMREPAVMAVRASASLVAPVAEHAAASSQRYASVAGSGKAVSLSPRRKVSAVVGEATAFAWGHAPAVGAMNSVVLPSGLAYRSPPQTHRAARASTPLDAASAAAAGAGMRRAPVTTIWTHRISHSSEQS